MPELKFCNGQMEKANRRGEMERVMDSRNEEGREIHLPGHHEVSNFFETKLNPHSKKKIVVLVT